MLASTQIQRRQSAVRERLAELAAVETPDEAQLTEMRSLDTEYGANETRLRAALVAEAEERDAAGRELERREDVERAELEQAFELRQVVQHHAEQRAFTGETAELIQELRQAGGFRGVPVPWGALETRATVSTGTPDPISTAPIISRLFPQSVAAQMGAQMINIDSGEREYPVTS
ncbi:MAG: phage major capsid protein, partial [Pseudomonadota bacterium]